MSWNDDITYAMTPLKLLTLPLGVWPLQKYNTFSIVRSFVCGFCMITMIFVLFLEINFGTSNAYVKLDALMIMFCNILCVLKLISFRIYADNLTRNFSSAVKDYLAIDNEGKRTIMRRHAFMGRMICYSIVLFAYIASLIFTLAPIIAGDGDLQLPTSVFFTISMMQLFILMLTATGNCGNDSLFLAIVLHVCGQMELLKMEFVKHDTTKKDVNKNFIVLASRHCYLMEHAELLANVISFVLLVQVLISCLIISFIGFQLILALKAHDAVMIIKTITVLSTLLLQLFYYSFASDYLKCQMEDIADSIYSSNWYCLPTTLMWNVLFVIMRSQQPVQLLAGKFLIVNIKTFMNILKSSLSYLSVLRVMVDA
ncbi:odorant receptor 49b isoform X2 [Solenopsis invicta]|uniref:odorant receptor 49b isoform X2 n=1 Tax=Solenopsis invicta TaxID=13686 RepID=UPI00193DBAFB|nr:odorant receptor 49b isoform X2 [Solenopsis invicta]